MENKKLPRLRIEVESTILKAYNFKGELLHKKMLRDYRRKKNMLNFNIKNDGKINKK
jgi:uncharacterized protein YycO